MDKGYPSGTSVLKADFPKLHLAIRISGPFLHKAKSYPCGTSVREADFLTLNPAVGVTE
jgi:hypothetical protein